MCAFYFYGKSFLHNNNNFCFIAALLLIHCCLRGKIQYLVPSNRGTLEVCTPCLRSYLESFVNKGRIDQFRYIKIKAKRITPSVPFVSQSLVLSRYMVFNKLDFYISKLVCFSSTVAYKCTPNPNYTPNFKPYSEFLEIYCDGHSSLSFTPAVQI